MKKRRKRSHPTVEQLEAEISREDQRSRFGHTARSTVYILITVAAAAILAATLFFPVLKIYGKSMAPTLDEGEIVVSLKNSDFATGDIIAFYFNNKVLIKRVICGPGDWIDIREDGTVVVNGSVIDEPYLPEKAFGVCDLALPYQVPEGQVFVMGDDRAVSVDSRSTAVGCVAKEQVVGRVLLCVWPLDKLGPVNQR